MLARRAALGTVISATLVSAFAVAGPAEQSPWKAAVPEAELAKLVTANTALIQDVLTQGLDEKKNLTRAKTAAVMIAGAAQSTMLGNSAKAKQMAGLRDHAIKLADAIENGKADDAKKLAADVSLTSKSVGDAKSIDLSKHVDLDSLMHQFKPAPAGGRGWEKQLKSAMAKKGTLSADEIKEIAQSSYQMAIVAQFTEALAPSADAGKKKKADWIKWSHEMGESAVALGKAAGTAKPDDRTVKTAIRKLDESCVKCHTVFRD